MNRYRSYAPADDLPLEEGDSFFVGTDSYTNPENLPQGLAQSAVNIDFSNNTAATRGGFVCLPSLGNAPFNASALWTSRTSAANKNWSGIAYGNGRFVAVSSDGGSSDVMYSTDAINWTSVSSGITNQWTSICFGNGKFVAVASSGAGNRAMYSADGQSWTAGVSSSDKTWRSVTYGAGSGLYVAVSSDGASKRCMTSPDGATWTDRTTPLQTWRAVTYGSFINAGDILVDLFIAVSNDGATNCTMYSTNGITWTAAAGANAFSWSSVTGGGSIFVAVAESGGTSAVMTTSDGITWTARTTPTDTWKAVTHGNSLFVAVSDGGISATGKVMTSPDGVTWTSRNAASTNAWQAIANSNNTFVAVSNDGSGNRVMTSGATSSVFASGIYSDPNDPGSQWIMLVGADTVGFYAFGRTARSVLISGYTVSQMSTVVQCDNLVYIFRGSSATPLYWTGDWSVPFTVAPTPSPSTGFQIIPNSNQATYYQNRLWVIDGKDEVAASDVLDFTAYDLLTDDFNLNTGDSDYLVTTFPFGTETLVVFKNKSIIAMTSVAGDLGDVVATEITRQVGAIGINAICSVGADLVYMSDRNVNLLTLTSTSNAIQHKTLPLSAPVQAIMDRVNWQAASKVSMGYINNKVYIALPLDNSTTCNAVIVYNFITETWFGEWSFDSQLGMAIQGWAVANYLGVTRLHCITEDGKIYVTNEGQNDICGTVVADIATSLTTRAYRFDNNNHVSRRLYMDLGTNRPNFSVVAFTDGANESSDELTDQTFIRDDSWRFPKPSYQMDNSDDDYNQPLRKDYSTGPDSVECGTGFLPEMLQSYRLPIISRLKGRLAWLQLTNSTGYCVANGVGVEARAGDRGSLIQVG